MRKEELWKFVTTHYAGFTDSSGKFDSKNWAPYVRSVFPSASDDDIICALSDIVSAFPLGREVPPEKASGPDSESVRSCYGFDFRKDVPDHRALEQMDSFMQNGDKSAQWDRAIRGLFRNDGGIGWEGVMKNDYPSFLKAWAAALEWCEASGKTWEEIMND